MDGDGGEVDRNVSGKLVYEKPLWSEQETMANVAKEIIKKLGTKNCSLDLQPEVISGILKGVGKKLQ